MQIYPYCTSILLFLGLENTANAPIIILFLIIYLIYRQLFWTKKGANGYGDDQPELQWLVELTASFPAKILFIRL